MGVLLPLLLLLRQASAQLSIVDELAGMPDDSGTTALTQVTTMNVAGVDDNIAIACWNEGWCRSLSLTTSVGIGGTNSFLEMGISPASGSTQSGAPLPASTSRSCKNRGVSSSMARCACFSNHSSCTSRFENILS